MKRELVWVAVIGVFFGLVIAFGVWRINSSLKGSRPDFPQETPGSQDQISEFKIAINSPEEGDVITTSPLSLTGITKALSWMVVSGEEGDYILQSDERGEFYQEVELVPGINQIKIFALDLKGNQNLEKVLVVYSSVFELKNTEDSQTENNATDEASVESKVSQKVAQASIRPKAYLGTVTDITNTTIQIKNIESQIEQISVADPDIDVVDIKGKNNKQVNLTDIAIGDFIVAMGYVNGNQVLDSQRILITDPFTENSISVNLARVKGETKTTLTVEDVGKNEESTLTSGKNVYIASYADGKIKSQTLSGIDTDNLTIYVMDTSGTPSLLRSIFDIGPSES